MKRKNKQTMKNKNKRNKQKQQKHIIAPCLHQRWRCFQTIALNDQQVGPTSLAPLSPLETMPHRNASSESASIWWSLD